VNTATGMASMEPLFFKAENALFRRRYTARLPASMEPLFFKAENIVHLQRVRQTDARFNGAAFFQSGKYDCLLPAIWCGRVGFNGAAFFQSGKCGERIGPPRKTQCASMEPLFFKAENVLAPDTGPTAIRASMEPLFFKAENHPSTPSGRITRTASMEPLFFKAENASLRLRA